MEKQPAFQFYPADWLQDTRALSLSAKGAWIDLLCAMWRARSRGKLTLRLIGYARLIGATAEQAKAVIDELIDMQVCDIVTESDGKVTLVNRRMVREDSQRNSATLRMQRWRNKQRDDDVTLASSSSSSSSSSLNKKDPTVTDTGAGTSADDPCTPIEPWPEDLLKIKEILEKLEVSYNGFYDPSYWRMIDEWVESTGLPVYYLDELKGYLAHQASKRPGFRGKHKDLKAGFRNWVATKIRWVERDAERKAIKQQEYRRS